MTPRQIVLVLNLARQHAIKACAAQKESDVPVLEPSEEAWQDLNLKFPSNRLPRKRTGPRGSGVLPGDYKPIERLFRDEHIQFVAKFWSHRAEERVMLLCRHPTHPKRFEAT